LDKVNVVNDVLNKCVKNSNLNYIDNTCQSIKSLKTESDTQGSRLLGLETMGSGSVWFDAFRTQNLNAYNSWDTITYTNARRSSNYPNAMSTSTGMFTAPLAGTYQFFIQVLKYNVYGAVQIVVDGTTVSRIDDNDKPHGATITGTAIIEMQPGQKAWAETYNTLESNSNGYIHFTGVLITPK